MYGNKFGRKNPWSKCNSLLHGVKGHAGVSLIQPEFKFLKNDLWPPNLVEKIPDPECNVLMGVKGLAGVSWGQPKVKWFRNAIWLLRVIRGQPEGYCLEMRRAIKCSQSYRALCSCRCSSSNKICITLTLTRGWWGRCEKNYLPKEEGREGGEKKHVR